MSQIVAILPQTLSKVSVFLKKTSIQLLAQQIAKIHIRHKRYNIKTAFKKTMVSVVFHVLTVCA